ncbi:tape measure protein [Neobacillus sp. PS3-40]|uniref:tape measure protein n=1 Tax=Neobacillus sp. PS3-40 TaxID=3070679 RepID=UPI0027E19651|nr:tape measure protein [Neobacillus sp. PS3-40]WML42706.1 tape measure protein [Neobacillus sp. PS3-40]
MAGGRVISAVLTLRDRDFSSNARRAGNGITDLDRRLRRTGNQVSRFRETAVSSFSSVAKGVAGLAAGYVSLKAVEGVASSAINAASSMEQYRNTLNVVMKDQKKAAEMMKWSVDFANRTPFETDSVVQATVKLQSYGLQAKKVMPGIGNMASVMNKDLDQAVEAVADAQTGELERMKEFGITKSMIAKQAGTMYRHQQIINNKGQIVDQQKFNNAMFSLMNDRFKGGMATQANSFKGVMSTITGVWKTGLASMAGISATGEIMKGSLFDVVKQKAKVFGDYIQKLANDGTFTKIGVKIGDGLKTAGHWFNVVKDNAVQMYVNAKPGIEWIKNTGLPGMKDGIGFVLDKAKGLYNFISGNWSLIGPVVAGVAASIATFKVGVMAITTSLKIWKGVTNAVAIAQGLLNGTLALTPLGWIVIGVGAVVAAGILLYKNWDTVKTKMSSVWKSIETGAAKMVNGTIDKLNWLIKKINLIPGIKIPIIPKVYWGSKTEKAGGINNSGAVSGAYLATHKNVPKNALGTSYFTGGPSLINERGGEIVDLPGGSRVYPHDKSVKMAKSEGKSIVINKIEVHAKGTTVNDIVRELVPQLKLALSNM